MSDKIQTETVSIDTKTDFIAQVKTSGVVVDGGDRLLHTEGEGRQTRYFIGDEKASKSEIGAEFEAVRPDDGAMEVHIPVEDAGDDEVVCRYCGDALGYLTGSHMDSHEGGPQTVSEYRAYVADMDGIDPEDVPLCTDDMMARFASGGHENDEETREKIGEVIKARWERGDYDHLRGDEAGA